MQNFLKEIEKLKTSHLYLILIVAAVLIASRVQYIQHGWINPDTVLYFESARLFELGQFKEALNVFNWPMYSLSIATVHKLTSLSIHHSAQLLSIIFFTITTISFTKIIELGGGNKKTMIAGAFILFSSPYIVGDVLEMLMRDQGFWACFLISLIFFVKFKCNYLYRDAFFWQTFAVAATLFRIEAIMYLLLLPLILLTDPTISITKRTKNFIKCNFLNIVIMIGIITSLSLNNEISMKNFGRLQEVFSSKLPQELTYNLLTKGQIMSDQVLGKYLQEYAIPGLVLTFIFAMALKSIFATGAINFALAAYSTSQKKLIKEPVYSILKASLLIALITMSLIIIKVFVLSGRYVVALAFILMIFASFQLGEMLTELHKGKVYEKKRILVISLIFIFMFGSIIKNIWAKPIGYNYMQEAATWVEINNPNNKPVFYNEVRLRYYAHESFDSALNYQLRNPENLIAKMIENNEIFKYEFLVLKNSNRHPIQTVIENLHDYHLVKTFHYNHQRKSILIYKKTSKDY